MYLFQYLLISWHKIMNCVLKWYCEGLFNPETPAKLFPSMGSVAKSRSLSAVSSLLKKGNRIGLRSKVNDTMITGVGVVDSMIPVGRGQRQLILGDRSTGKTSIFITSIIVSISITAITTIDGYGTRRLFLIYIAINQNLSKISTIITKVGKI